MKLKIIAILAPVLVVALNASAATTEITGILSDDMCTKKHMMPGNPDADCVRACIKHGAKFVVVSQGKVYKLEGRQEQLNELAGKKITVSGELKGTTIAVAKVNAAQ